ncbi:MAG TPA: palindromic element RPE4 domain-containing protein [Rickettsia endosymbiont of Pyrocoelia pectoralis]|nr:palindromic element RPE4 domain-containing protein [Rickettsia endosymbiont of Pyrocoelia pectoralis]
MSPRGLTTGSKKITKNTNNSSILTGYRGQATV